ncbi:gustatory receptor for sugar taste 43a isoform X2 [Venturia canescens]|nr:gustatory receptor for sugar taste 43a isoform X2 [Venturia canescens]XP_043289010.1 gustatory receptor for sugar taste 43a isoform X2 [Venturia canescens]
MNKAETMNKPVKTDLYYALFPIYYLSKILGLLPVRFVAQTTGRYLGQIRVIDVCYGVGLLFLFIIAEIWGLWRDLGDGWEHSTRLKSQNAMIVTIGDVLAVILLASVGVIGAPFRWAYIQDIMARLVEADERLGFIAPRKTRNFSIIVSTTILIFLVGLSILDFYTWHIQTKLSKKMANKGPINYAPIYFMYIIALVIEIQFTVSTYNLGERFTRLNKNLENLIKDTRIQDYARKEYAQVAESRDQANMTAYIRPEVEYRTNVRVYRTPKISDWLIGEGESRNISDALSQLITVHASLCDCTLLINRAFGVPILVVTITCLLHLIITPYVLLIEVTSNKDRLFMAVQCLWCIVHIMRMMIVVQPCYATSSEAKLTAIRVSQLLSANSEPAVRKQLEIFSLQLLHRPLDFSACGMFSIDRALVTSMAGAVTTYLVILIQFQKADDTVDASNKLKNATQELLKNASSLTNSTAFKFFQ